MDVGGGARHHRKRSFQKQLYMCKCEQKANLEVAELKMFKFPSGITRMDLRHEINAAKYLKWYGHTKTVMILIKDAQVGAMRRDLGQESETFNT